MESKSGSGKKSGSTRSRDAGDKDRLIAELKNRVAVLENELKLKQSDTTSQEIIDRKLMGEYLVLIQRMVDKAADMVFLLGPMGRIQYTNEAACKALGYTREELQSMTVFDLNLKHHVDNWQEHEEELKKQGSMTFENVLKTKDNRLIPVEISANYARLGDKEYNYSFIRDITERKLAEEVLRESEARRKVAEAVEAERRRLFDVLENLPAMVCLLTPDYNVAFANRSYRERFGESHGRHCYEYCFGRTEPCEFCEAYTVLKTGKPHHWEVKGPDDSLIEVYNSPFTDVDGSPMILKMSVDITERKRAEEALRESERKFRAIFDQTLQFIGLLTTDGTLLEANKTALEFVGATESDVVGKPFWDTPWWTHSPELRAQLRDAVVKAARGEVVRFEATHRASDGCLHYIDFSLKPVADESGNVVLVIPEGRDITERKRAEEALRESEENFRGAFEQAAVGMTHARKDGSFMRVNQKFCDITGYAREELVKMTARDITYPPDMAGEIRLVERLLAGELSTFSREKRYVRKDGAIVWVNLTVTPIFHKGTLEYLTGITEDITERKRAEEALKAAKMEADLYVDLMCHDISNMNQVGMGFLEMAMDMLDLDEAGREMLQKPKSAFEGSTKLIDNVRKLQRARSGEFQDKDMDIGQVLRDVQYDYSKQHGPNVTINYLMNAGYMVKANELLYDLFSNLVGNAIKHSKGHPIIDINVEPVRENGCSYYKVTIDDQGPGIPDVFKAVIFDRKLTGDAKSKGSGIGLFLVKTLVDSYHGRVWVEDRVKGDYTKGAMFVVMLPAIEK